MASWKKLRSKQDYKKALASIDNLIDAKENEGSLNELMLLSYLVEEYEREFLPIPDASPLEVIRFMMEMKGIRQKDLISVLGTKGYVSKILSGVAQLRLDMIEPLSKFLGIPVESLIPRSGEPIGVKTEYDSKSSSRAQAVRESSQGYAKAVPKGKK